jgi:hypothetical protein
MVNTYIINRTHFSFREAYFPSKYDHIDYLFIGESRFPAAVDVSLINSSQEGVLAVNAARGYIYGGVHYWALTKFVQKYPGILNNSTVIIDNGGGMEFTRPFEQAKFHINEDNPHLFLPHLNFSLLIDYLKHSDNKLKTKIKLSALYSCALYRGIPLINSTAHRLFAKYASGNELTEEGGIKTEKKSILAAQQLLIKIAGEQIANQKYQSPFSEQDLDKSLMAAFRDLITSNGGRLVLLNMPLHSLQQAVYDTDLSRKNRETFARWAESRDIPIITVTDFKYYDGDFPDYWHLGRNRRAEYTEKVYGLLQTLK